MVTTTPDLARCCLTCHATAAPDGGSLKACGGCKKARYCSQACQAKDRKQHRIFCSAIAEHVPTGSAGEALEDRGRDFARARFDELYTAGVVALKLLKDTTYHLTHSVACCFVPNETWTEGDHVNRRYKLYGGAAVSDDYLTQHLSWYQSTGHLKGDNVSAIGPPQSGNAELTKFTIRRWAFFKLPGAVPVRWKSYSWSVSGYGDFKAPTPADLAIVESEGSMENLARKLLA